MNILERMWDVAKSLISGIDSIWDFLNSTVDLNIKLFGFKLGIPSFVPIEIIGAGLIVFIVLWLVKELIPAS